METAEANALSNKELRKPYVNFSLMTPGAPVNQSHWIPWPRPGSGLTHKGGLGIIRPPRESA
jgi:hypothetical protein